MSTEAETEPTGPITREQAIEAATKYLEGRVELSPQATIVVDEDEAEFIVEWKLPATRRGPDFDARVFVNKQTGVVRTHMVGS